jgi:hypothetical protein
MAGSLLREVTEFVNPVGRGQLRIVAVPVPSNSYTMNSCLRPLTESLLMGLAAISLPAASRISSLMQIEVPKFKAGRDVDPVADNGVAQPLARSDISDQDIRAM